MIGAKVRPTEFFFADDMRLWTAILFGVAIIVTIVTVISAWQDYKATRDPEVAADRPMLLTTAMVLRQEILMLGACTALFIASILRVLAAAPEPGLSVAQSALYCLAAAVLATKSVLVNRYRARILALGKWGGEERRSEKGE